MSCTTKNCFNKVLAKGLCTKCYYRVKRGGTPEISKKQQMALRKCSIAGCGKPHFANDLCSMHKKRLDRHGDPLFINPKCNRDGNYIKRARTKTAQWKKLNAELNVSFNQSRKTRMRKSSKIERETIKQFYLNCPDGHVVDHIIPINHEYVSGLHCIANLQYLSKNDNAIKSNKFDFTYDNKNWKKYG